MDEKILLIPEFFIQQRADHGIHAHKQKQNREQRFGHGCHSFFHKRVNEIYKSHGQNTPKYGKHQADAPVDIIREIAVIPDRDAEYFLIDKMQNVFHDGRCKASHYEG